MSEKKTRIVLAGCGGISRGWVKAAKERADVELVGLVDLREEATKKLATDLGLTVETGTDLESMLGRMRPDVVFDCTVPEAHVTVTLTALKHGCHVLGEKPLADTMDNARRMVAAAKEAGRIYAVIQNRRYDVNIRALRAFIASGALGRLKEVHCDFYIGAHFGGFRDRMEHVLLLDMAIHTFDAARLISGESAQSVICHEWNPPGSWYDHDASAVAVFEMTNGVVYSYRGSWCSEGLNTSWESTWRIIGEKGSATWDGGQGLRAEVVTGDTGFTRPRQEVKIPVPDATGMLKGHAGVIDEFIRCVRNGGTPETICTDNIKSLAMVHSAIQSAPEGRRVTI